MSVVGYLIRRSPEWRMPRMRRDDVGRDEFGMRVEGPVLSGEKPVDQVGREDSVRAGSAAGQRYSKVEEYDPVLKSHCRL